MSGKSILVVAVLATTAAFSPKADAQQRSEQAKIETEPPTIALPLILDWQEAVHSNAHRLLVALPRVPSALSVAIVRVESEAAKAGIWPVGVIRMFVSLVGIAMEWSARSLQHRAWREHQSAKHGVMELLPLMSFTLVSGIVYIVPDWPPLTGAVLFIYGLGAIGFRLAWAICAMAFTSGALTNFMFRRSMLFVAIFIFALTTNACGTTLSVDPDSMRCVSVMFSILLLVVSSEAVWRHRVTSGKHVLRRKILRTVGLLALWFCWFAGLHIVFWLGIYAIAFPIVLPLASRLGKTYGETHWPRSGDSSVAAAISERGFRAIVVSVAVLWLVGVWQIYPNGSERLHSLLDIFILGLLKSLLVLLAADLGWNVARVMIDRKLSSVLSDGHLSRSEIAHRARLRTLLPIFRNGLAALVFVITILTVLAEMGIEVGPLIAGAGIFGVAIGFGSQTLVKDIISGIFYLMDDAFRVGEYIQSGSYM
ncbi:mechanosensitive ion channel domain-containing protein [Rhizobium sp. S163]|uniref:mechanosensitive ion channel family protein n=1 Tax=Rhizobium sp. S163 TaxID=3055039 RepID=UPI00339D8EB2